MKEETRAASFSERLIVIGIIFTIAAPVTYYSLTKVNGDGEKFNINYAVILILIGTAVFMVGVFGTIINLTTRISELERRIEQRDKRV